VFITVDHQGAGCVGIHAARRGTRFKALESIRQAARQDLAIRHDHGSQYLSDASRTNGASSA
jgi:putative transposase